MSKNVLITLLVLLCVACLCLLLGLCLAGGASYLFILPKGSSGQVPPQVSTPVQLPSATVVPPVSATQGATEQQLPADVSAQMDEIESQVSQLRGLQLLSPVDRRLITTDELSQQVSQDFFKDYSSEDIQDDQRTLAVFGLLDPNFDLYDLYINLYTEQIAGYYDSETKEMYVIQDEGFGGPERLTYAHEFTHVLQDQHYDLQDGLKLNNDYCLQHSEYCGAVTALIEGDATLSEQYWLYTYGTPQDQQQLQDFYDTYQSPVYDSAPAFLQKDLMFPYEQGLQFVGTLFTQGGYDQVDAAFANPPVSTEMILHPERYPDDTPVPVNLPDLATMVGRPLDKVEDGELGEWYTYLVLAAGRDENARLSDDVATPATEGWGGDAYSVYWDAEADSPVMALDTVWDTSADADEFAAAFRQYAEARWGAADQSTEEESRWDSTDTGAVAFFAAGDETIWVVAPDTTDVDAILHSLTVTASR